MRFVKCHQLQYDKAWKKLMDSKVLRSSKTEEFIYNIYFVFQRASERMQAEKAIESAKSAVMLAQKAITDLHALVSLQARASTTVSSSLI